MYKLIERSAKAEALRGEMKFKVRGHSLVADDVDLLAAADLFVQDDVVDQVDHLRRPHSGV